MNNARTILAAIALAAVLALVFTLGAMGSAERPALVEAESTPHVFIEDVAASMANNTQHLAELGPGGDIFTVPEGYRSANVIDSRN